MAKLKKSQYVLPSRSDMQIDQVDNTRDIDKPISNATQAALDSKASSSSVSSKAPIDAPQFTTSISVAGEDGDTNNNFSVDSDGTNNIAFNQSTGESTTVGINPYGATVGASSSSSNSSLEVTPSGVKINRTTAVTASNDVLTKSNLDARIPVKITVGTTAPSNPSEGDLWVDTN